jgi:uncharacterized membrane protein
MESAELLLEQIVHVVALIMELTAVLCIVAGFIESVVLMLQKRQQLFSPLFTRLRFKFGGWLILALEFQLAADIINTAVAPTYEHLIQLGAIAVIRTFLNYFLSKELHELHEAEKNSKTA